MRIKVKFSRDTSCCKESDTSSLHKQKHSIHTPILKVTYRLKEENELMKLLEISLQNFWNINLQKLSCRVHLSPFFLLPQNCCPASVLPADSFSNLLLSLLAFVLNAAAAAAVWWASHVKLRLQKEKESRSWEDIPWKSTVFHQISAMLPQIHTLKI